MQTTQTLKSLNFTAIPKWEQVLTNIAHVDVAAVWGIKTAGGEKKASKPSAPAPLRNEGRVLIEFCCGPDSLLGQSTAASKGCEVVRLTEKEDVTTEVGLKVALRAANKKNVLLWSSIPCTGGCSYCTCDTRISRYYYFAWTFTCTHVCSRSKCTLTSACAPGVCHSPTHT